MKINDNGVDRDMTKAEVAEYEAWAFIAQAEAEAQAEAAAEQAAAKRDVLDRLGITAEEARMLLS